MNFSPLLPSTAAASRTNEIDLPPGRDMTRLPNRRLLALALAAVTGAPARAQAAAPVTGSARRGAGRQRGALRADP
ncbi:hypothetical protein G6F66_015564 [Rhizopus arrhizus]|nr:hypothetical protein G6F66_015564 [Rhizopus arrhizus]